MHHLEFAAHSHGPSQARSLPDGLRMLQTTPMCERCRRGQTVEVRGVGGRLTALCAGCSRSTPQTRSVGVLAPSSRSTRVAHNSVARARLALAEVE